MRQQTKPPLVQKMACQLFSDRPSFESMMVYCWLDPWKQTSVKFEYKYNNFKTRKYIWKCRLQKIISSRTHVCWMGVFRLMDINMTFTVIYSVVREERNLWFYPQSKQNIWLFIAISMVRYLAHDLTQWDQSNLGDIVNTQTEIVLLLKEGFLCFES